MQATLPARRQRHVVAECMMRMVSGWYAIAAPGAIWPRRIRALVPRPGVRYSFDVTKVIKGTQI